MCQAVGVVALCFQLGLGEEIDKQALLRILEALYAPLSDVSCEYEGTMAFPGQPGDDLGPDGIYDEFSGVYLARLDGSVFADIYHRHYPELRLHRRTIAMIDGRYEEYSREIDRPGEGGVVHPAHFGRLNRTGSLERLLCHTRLLGYLRHDDWQMRYEGTEMVDGHPCLVVTFGQGRNLSTNLERFWIDLERGGHALKRESLRDGGRTITHRMYDVELRKVAEHDGMPVWLPISGKYAGYGAIDDPDPARARFLDTPTNLDRYKVLVESIRLNTRPPDSRFSVRFRQGTPITDRLRRVQYEFGQSRLPTERLTRAETEEMLREQLRQAEEQGDELVAASWERRGARWAEWLPWGVAVAAVAAVAALAIRRRAA